MKRDRGLHSHLMLKKTLLPPGGEWGPERPGWCFVQLTQGAGYLRQARLTVELACGSVLLLSEHFLGCIRSSQLTETHLGYFYVQPEKLLGLLTLADQKKLAEAAAGEQSSFRVFSPEEPVARAFGSLWMYSAEASLLHRLRMLELFGQAFARALAGERPEPPAEAGARQRLKELLEHMPAAAMLDLTFGALAAQVGCCPRHLGRLFQEVVGMPFRHKQAEIRLARAQELLVTTKSKVLEVAMESGYQSLSLFNSMFKRRFGVTPLQWRQRPRDNHTLLRVSSARASSFS